MSTGHPGPTRGATNARVFSINTVGPSTRGFRICRFNQPRRTTAVSRSRPRGWLNPVVPVPSVGQGAVTRGSPTVEVALLTRLVAQESQRPPTEIHFFTVLVAGSPRLRWQQIRLRARPLLRARAQPLQCARGLPSAPAWRGAPPGVLAWGNTNPVRSGFKTHLIFLTASPNTLRRERSRYKCCYK